MIILSGATATILFGLAVLHVLWGLRVWWPIADEATLARAVAGFPGISAMPAPASCFIVAAFLACAAMLVLDLGGIFQPDFRLLKILGGVALAGILMIRGILGYLPIWARLTPEQPFRTLDILYYSPLCLALGISIAILVFGVVRS